MFRFLEAPAPRSAARKSDKAESALAKPAATR